MPRRARPIPRLGMRFKQRMMMFRVMTTQLVKHERIQTTYPKAKAVAKYANKIVGYGKRGMDGNKRFYGKAFAFLTESEMVEKLFTVIGPRYRFRTGGYVRVVRTKRRMKDMAPMAYLEFVDRPGELRPANTASEDKYKDFQAGGKTAFQKFKAWRLEENKKLLDWKVKITENPYSDMPLLPDY